MTTTPAAYLRSLPAFQDLSDEAISAIDSQGRILRYKIGQTISDRGVLSSEITILLNGQGRLLASDEGQIVTAGRLQAGSIIGLAASLPLAYQT